MTVDRHWLGDVALAVLFALSLVALARPRTEENHSAAASVKVATADRLPGNGRISLLG